MSEDVDTTSAGRTSTAGLITWPRLLHLGADVAHRRRSRAELDGLFNGGFAEPIEGVGHLRLVTTFLGRPIDVAMNRFENAKRPWLAKVFDADANTGTNWLATRPRGFARIVGPRAKYDKLAGARTLDGLPFRTWIGESHIDAGQDVLHVDYSSEPSNPAVMRRFTHDEVVKVGDGIFLGRVHCPPLRTESCSTSPSTRTIDVAPRRRWSNEWRAHAHQVLAPGRCAAGGRNVVRPWLSDRVGPSGQRSK